MKLNYIKNNKQQWSSWKLESDCTAAERKEANLRELMDNEVILDCESKEQCVTVRKQLKKDHVNFDEWDTGSRGEHFHLTIDGLDQLTDQERKEYREKVIKRYDCDIAKKSGVIARENKPHFKTGKLKKVIHKGKGSNKLDMSILQIIKKMSWFTVDVPKHNADELKKRLPISDVIKELGGRCFKNGLASCPLHLPDKNPSMTYDDDKGLWYCFHKQFGGDVFNLLQEKKGISFIEAKRKVAEMAGYPDVEFIQEGNDLDFGLQPVSNILDGDVPQPQFRVEGLIPESGVTYLAAPPGVGKSMLMLYLSCCISAGEPFLGKKVIQGKVMYFDAENGEICAYNRLKRITEGHTIEKARLNNFYYSIFPNLRFDTSHQSYTSMIQITREFKPSVIIFDSLVRFMDGSENDAESCKKVFDYIQVLLKDNPQLTIIILHHLSKNNMGGMNAMRGSSELAASATTILLLHRKRKGIIITIEKSRYLDLNDKTELFYKIYDEKGLLFAAESIEEAPTDAIGTAREDWDEWIAKQSIESFSTEQMQKQLHKKAHSRDATFKLLNDLLDQGTIKRMKRGKYAVVEFPATVEYDEITPKS